ncbi:hypothetical protein MA092_001891 [Salmonella enterica]|nr:hypothetical protein [Salmonella enterica]
MTHCQSPPVDTHAGNSGTLCKILQQATDQYPRLAAFLLPLPVPELHFHDVVYQQVRELAISRRLSGRPVPPTVLRWMWEKKNVPGQSCRHLLLMNQDTFCHPHYDKPPGLCFETMESLLRDTVSTINDVWHPQPRGITVLRVDRTHLAQADVQYSRLRECALSLVPAATALSERISP